MKCEGVRRLFDDYYENILDAATTKKIDEHLGECEDCRRELEQIENLSLLIRASSEVDIPDEAYFSSLFERVMGTTRKPSVLADLLRRVSDRWYLLIHKPSPGLGFARACAFIAVGLLIGIFAGKASQSPPGEMVAMAPRATPRPAIAPLAPRDTSPGMNVALTNLDPAPQPPTIENAVLVNTPAPTYTRSAVAETYLPLLPPLFSKEMKADIKQLIGAEESEPIRSASSDKLALLVKELADSNVFEEIQGVKLELYNAGDYELIPPLHRLEEMLYNIVAADEKTTRQSATSVKTYRQAESFLLDGNYFDSIESFYDVIKEDSSGFYAYLSRLHLGNIDFEVLQDYSGALDNYQICLEDYPSHYITEGQKSLILSRLNELTNNSQDDFEPLRLYYSAQYSDPSVAVEMYCDLVEHYPKSSATRYAIRSLREFAIFPDYEDIPLELIIDKFQQFLRSNPDSKYSPYIQFAIADIFNYRLNDYEQAKLEYSQIANSDLSDLVEERIRKLYARAM